MDTDQDGKMPACLWGQEYEIGFVSTHLGPQLATNNIDTRIWILDHNCNLWGRANAELDDPEVNRSVDGVAWHGYVGERSAMTRVHEAHPQKHVYWTEGGPAYNDPRYLTNWSHWASGIAGVLRNWSRCFIAWNLALDEAGNPNLGPFNCGGVVTIDSKTGEITRSGQFWALAHYASRHPPWREPHRVVRGAKRAIPFCLPQVIPTLHYTNDEMLLSCLEADVIAPAEQKARELQASA